MPPDPTPAARAPTEEAITAYDRAHHTAYLRLLDAEAVGTDWRDAARDILALDPAADPAGARQTWQSHINRARWMTTTGFRLLLASGTLPRKSADS